MLRQDDRAARVAPVAVKAAIHVWAVHDRIEDLLNGNHAVPSLERGLFAGGAGFASYHAKPKGLDSGPRITDVCLSLLGYGQCAMEVCTG